MNLAGAYLVQGGPEMIAAVLEILKKEGVAAHGNPDMYVRTYAHFGIEEARSLRSRASLRAIRERRVFVLSMRTMTAESQNALLKTVEDGTGNALFVFITPAPQTLLPTLRSRAQTLELAAREARGLVDAEAFLRADGKSRLDMLKPLLDKDDDDKRDIGAAITFLSSLERTLCKRFRDSRQAIPVSRQGLLAIYRARKYVGDKGALLKPLLEHVALLV